MNINGAIFDLDGVLVDTIPLHYAAWKRLFKENGYSFNEQIYREKVDGLPRLDGVLGVMSDLDIKAATEAGNLKQGYFLELIVQQGVQPFLTTIHFVDSLKRRGIPMAVASSSVNAPTILEKIGVLDDFETVVTAEDVEHGKPHPEIFQTAAQRLGVPVANCVVFEDAESGVEAAKQGGFFCVGINRRNDPNYLNQADLRVTDLGEIDFIELDNQFQSKS